MIRPLLSVVVVSHNPNPDWLIAACRSCVGVADQIVVINNGSTGKFPRLDVNYCYQDLPKNVGYAVGTNIGVAKASCPWVMLLDDDDLCVTENAKILKQMLVNSDPRSWLDAIAFPINLFMREDAIGEQWGEPFNPEKIYEVNHIPNSTWFNRRQFLNAGGFKHDVAGDWEFWCRLHSRGGAFDWFDKPVVNKRMRADSFSAAWTPEQHEVTHSEIRKLVVEDATHG